MKTKNNVITYTVNKVANTGIYISVQNGEVVVNAPWYLSRNRINQMVKEKRQWILQKIKEYETTNIESSNLIKILGKNYELKVNYRMVKIPTLDIIEKQIRIVLPISYKKIDSGEIVQTLIKKMYQMVAEKEIEKMMEKTRLMLGIAPEDYEIKNMAEKIASCSENKKITINPNIVKYDRKTIEYILLHEFCHLQYKIHSKGFKKMMQAYMPEYEYYEKILENICY